MANTSVRGRFIYSVLTNIFRTLIGLVTVTVLARWLGPSSYGDMAFLLGTFVAIRQILEMGTSSAFFTFLSQRPRSRKFVRYFFYWQAFQFLTPLILIGVVFPTDTVQLIWHGQSRYLVLCAFAASFMQNGLLPAVMQAAESQRNTRQAQVASTIPVLVNLGVLILFKEFGVLNLYTIFLALAFEHFVASLYLQSHFVFHASDEDESKNETPEAIFKQYWKFCFPMIPLVFAGFMAEFADRWLLQHYGGAVEQAYFSIGAQVTSVALLATTSILKIFWKEIAEVHHQGDSERARQLYQKVSRILFMVGAIMAGFLIPWSEDILRIILGKAYIGGTATLMLMFLYPIHQALGQINGVMLYATERMRLYAVTSIIFTVVGIIVSYFVLASNQAVVPGLSMGSEGLAIKMVVLQMFGVNIVSYLIARVSKWRFDWTFQPIALIGCFLFGYCATFVVNFVGEAWPLILRMGIAGFLYAMLLIIYLYLMPSLVGMSRDELSQNIRGAWKVLLRPF